MKNGRPRPVGPAAADEGDGAAGTFREDLARGFPAYGPALDAHWMPYLDGDLTLEAALRGLVSAAALARGRVEGAGAR